MEITTLQFDKNCIKTYTNKSYFLFSHFKYKYFDIQSNSIITNSVITNYNKHPIMTNKLKTLGWYRSYKSYNGYNEQNKKKDLWKAISWNKILLKNVERIRNMSFMKGPYS